MGFQMDKLRASTADAAKAGAAAVSKLEEGSQAEEQQAPAAAPAVAPARPNAFAPRIPPSNAPSAAPSAPAAPARPSFAAPSRPPEPTQASAAPVRPSFGGAPTAAAPSQGQPSRPSFGNGSVPSARGVFVKNPAKFGGTPGNASSEPSASSQMSPQALFEVVCTHRNMSAAAIEAARAQAHDDPERVMAQMRRIYENEIAPSRVKHADDLPRARQENPDKIVFLLRKDDKERIRIMPRDAAEESGEDLLNGTTVENIHAASSPFQPPSELFMAVEQEIAPVPAQPAEPTHRSPKP